MTAHTWQFICQRAGLWAGLERGFGTNHWSAIAEAKIDPGYHMRNKLLNEHLFDNLRHACNLAVEWRTAFNHHRPHSSLAGLTLGDYVGWSKEGQRKPATNLYSFCLIILDFYYRVSH